MDYSSLHSKTRDLIKTNSIIKNRQEMPPYFSVIFESGDNTQLLEEYEYLVKKFKLIKQKPQKEQYSSIKAKIEPFLAQGIENNPNIDLISKTSATKKYGVHYFELSNILSGDKKIISQLSAPMNRKDLTSSLHRSQQGFINQFEDVLLFEDESKSEYQEFSRRTAFGHEMYQIIYRNDCMGNNSQLQLNAFDRNALLAFLNHSLEFRLNHQIQ